MRQVKFLACAGAVGLLYSTLVNATPFQSKITVECEKALALSALPLRLRDQASVYTLGQNGFQLSQSSDGPFTCIVERNHPNSIIPQCADKAGADSVIPGIIQKSEWTLAGMSPEERKKRFEVLVQKGEMRAPSRPGINYMMSNFNLAWNTKGGQFMRLPPHVMFYAPNLSNEDVGGSFQEAMGGNRGTPYIVDVGIHGYMTTLVEHASDSSDVYKACEGQVSTENVKTLGGK